MLCITEVVSNTLMAPVGTSPYSVSHQANKSLTNNKTNTVKSNINNKSFDSRMKDTSIRNSLTNKPVKNIVSFRYTV